METGQNRNSHSILVVHPQFDVIGGAELVSLRIIQWLLATYDVRITILSLTALDMNRACREAGILIPTANVTTVRADVPWWLRKRRDRFHLIRLAYLHRHAKKIADLFDACIGTYNEIDFGRRGFQFVEHPNIASRRAMHSVEMIGNRNITDAIPFLELLYKRIVFGISRDTPEGYRRNITASNSEFIRDLLARECGIDSTVVYPSIVSGGRSVTNTPWDDRKLQFVSVGRISPDKNLFGLVDLYKDLSEALPGARFVIIGRVSNPAFLSELRLRIASSGVRIEILTGLDNEALQSLLQSSRFYIGPKRFEHFGVATLEAVHAGCLTFVHDSGGQREIVSPPLLRYSSGKELVQKVLQLTSDDALRVQTMAELQRGALRLTDNEFQSGLDATLRPFLSSLLHIGES